jgi:cytochrome c oxidase subunit I+III
MPADSPSLEQLEQTWRLAHGFPGALAEVNNQPIGKRFMLTAMIFFALGGVLALLMRMQLAVSENTLMGPQVYNQLFTMHGSTMMFLFAVPFLEGLALYLLPMMLGARDVCFPRLTAYGYWTYLFGGLIFYASFLFGAVPEAGWFAYTPLSGSRFTDGYSTDFWLLGLSLVEIAGLTTAVEIVATILKFRAPGMSLARMPLFVWTMLVTGIMIIFAFTVLLTATVLLELDRSLETRFFDPHFGGSSLLWQHLFWFFGHPEVYIMFLPATGIVSAVVATGAQRPVVGYSLIVVAIVVTGFVSFGLWVHHMFAAGIPSLAKSFFTASSLMIAIASGVQIFAWIATLWGTRPRMSPPVLFVLGFFFLFVLGGMTGVMVAVVPFDLQVHDTFFVVAHFHYVLIGGVVFPIFAGLHYWLPKITGRLLDRGLGHLSFWFSFIGFNLTFFPMHIMGFLGLPRRVFTYPGMLELDAYNLVATIGAFLLGAGFVVFTLNAAWSLKRGSAAEGDPWRGDSLEWSVSSPPPNYTFLAPPIVNTRYPNWETDDDRSSDEAVERIRDAMRGLPDEWRGTLVTDALDAQPQAIQWLPGPTYVPLWTALATTAAAAAVLGRAYILAAVATAVTAVLVAAWLRPRQHVLDMLRASGISERVGLPVMAQGTQSPAWWGLVGLIAMLATVFAALAYTYFYLRLFSDEWPQGDVPQPRLWMPLVGTALLLGTSGAMAWSHRQFRRGEALAAKIALAGAIVGGLAFGGLQLIEWLTVGYTPRINAYASAFFVMHWFLTVSVMVGLGLNVTAQLRLWREPHDRDGFMGLLMQLASLYWQFVVVLGLLTLLTLYASPYALGK